MARIVSGLMKLGSIAALAVPSPPTSKKEPAMTKPVSIRLVPLVALLILAAMQYASAQGPGSTSPAQFRDVNNPPRLSKLVFGHATLSFLEGSNQTVGPLDFGTLPAGKMVVIESITAQASAGAGNGILLTLFSNPGFPVQTYIGMTPVGTVLNGDSILAATEALRLYAMSDSPVLRVNATQVGDPNNIRGNVIVSVTGYIIDP